MKLAVRSIAQALVLLVIAVCIGMSVNALSSEPLPLLRTPVDEIEEPWPVISGEEVLQHVNEGTAIIIDARKAEDYALGSIVGSINIPFDEFDSYFSDIGPSLPRDFLIVVYCGGGLCTDSHEILQRLEELGFEELALYKNGWEEWVKEGYPTQ